MAGIDTRVLVGSLFSHFLATFLIVDTCRFNLVLSVSLGNTDTRVNENTAVKGSRLIVVGYLLGW